MHPKKLLPSVNLLSCFEATARHLSFTLAAEELFLTQSAVSRQISDLERMLNTKLFARQGKSVELTLTGAQYAHEVSQALERIRGATHQVYAAMNRPTLRLGVPPILGSEWLLPRLHQFHAQHGEIRIHMHSHFGEGMDFDTGIDACIAEADHAPPALISHHLMTSRVILVASPTLLAQRPLQRISDLYAHTLLQATYNKKGWSNFFLRNGLDATRITLGCMFDYTDHLIQAVKTGMGIALASEAYVASALHTGALIAVDLPDMVFDNKALHLLYPPEHASNGVLMAFRDWLLSPPENRAAGIPQHAAPCVRP